METKRTINLWESLGKTLKRIEKHNAHQLDIDTALQQIRELYVEILKRDTKEDTKPDAAIFAATQHQENKITDKQAHLIKEEITEDIRPENITSQQEAVEEAVEKAVEEEIAEEIAEETKDIDASDSDIDKAFNPASEPMTQNDSVNTVKQTEAVESEKVELKEESSNPVSNTTNQASLFNNDFNKPTESLGETLGKDKKSMNESIGISDNHLAKKFQAKPIADIRAGINLGDRFLFIKELFNGNTDEFNQTIDNLNEKRSFDEAQEILGKYNWDSSNKTVNYFLSIVQRKYIPKN